MIISAVFSFVMDDLQHWRFDQLIVDCKHKWQNRKVVLLEEDHATYKMH